MADIQVKRWTELEAPSPAVLVWHLEHEGYFAKHWVAQPGMVYAWRKTAEAQSHWVISGEVEIIHQEGLNYTLKAGDRDFIPAQSWYMRRVIGEEPLSYFVGEKIKEEKPKRKRGRPKKL